MSAEFAVSLVPSDGPTLYLLEVKEYKLIVVNVSDSFLDSVNVVLSVPDEIALVIEGDDRRERQYTFHDLAPGERREEIFTVKALEPTNFPVKINALYEINGNENTSTTSVLIERSDFIFSSRLNKTSLAPDSEATVFFDLTNNTDSKITNITVELVSNDSIIIDSPSLDVGVLEPGQSISNSEFDFIIGEGIGRKVVVLRVFFDDEKGTHILERSFFLDVQNRDIYVALLIAAIIGLVIISFYIRRKKQPEKVESEGVKLEVIDSTGEKKTVEAKTEKKS